jgi:hypothetical protein
LIDSVRAAVPTTEIAPDIGKILGLGWCPTVSIERGIAAVIDAEVRLKNA